LVFLSWVFQNLGEIFGLPHAASAFAWIFLWMQLQVNFLELAALVTREVRADA
jgi:hypothetical protein